MDIPPDASVRAGVVVGQAAADLEGSHGRFAVRDNANRAALGAEVRDHEDGEMLREVRRLRHVRGHGANDCPDHNTIDQLQRRESTSCQWERRLNR